MKVDMSSRAIDNRLRRVSQLRRLCLSLGKAEAVKQKTTKRQKKYQKKLAPI